MPSDFTKNYGLSQWEKSDRVLMEDFNADNAKIDAALKAEADARTAADAAHELVLSKLRNCQIYISSYVGDGSFGPDNPKELTLPGVPALLLIFGNNAFFHYIPLKDEHACVLWDNARWFLTVTWDGSTAIWYGRNNDNESMNQEGATYRVLAFYETD